MSTSTPSNDDIEAVIQAATSSPSSSSSTYASMRPPRDTRTQLFVGNLPYRVRWQDLKDLFRRAGTVLRADVSLAPDNRSRGYGTVLLATAEDAGRAVDMFNGYVWQTRTLEVRQDKLGGGVFGDEAHFGVGVGVGLGGGVLGGGALGEGESSSTGSSGAATPFSAFQAPSRFSAAASLSNETTSGLGVNTHLHHRYIARLASPTTTATASEPLLATPSPLSSTSPLLAQLTGTTVASGSLVSQQHNANGHIHVGERSRNLFVGNVSSSFFFSLS